MAFNDINVGEGGNCLFFIMSKAYNGKISSRLFQQPTQNKVTCFIRIMLEGAGCKLLPFAYFSFGRE